MPQECYGRFFGLRRVANLVVMVFLPCVASLLRGDWSNWQSDESVRWAYIVVFLSGGLLLLLTVIPLLRVPEVPVRWNRAEQGSSFWDWEMLTPIWSNRSLRFVLISSCWLAVAQGLTQTAFYQYQTQVLHLKLETYFLLSGLMYLLQIPFSWLGGAVSDRFGDKGPLLVTLPLVSCAMLFWLLATPDHPEWMIGAYAVWGLFGLINVTEWNILLRVSPKSDNALPLAFSRSSGGLLTALSGLAGGILLDLLLRRFPLSPLFAYQVLFVTSWVLRCTAAFWLAPVQVAQSMPTADRSPDHD